MFAILIYYNGVYEGKLIEHTSTQIRSDLLNINNNKYRNKEYLL